MKHYLIFAFLITSLIGHSQFSDPKAKAYYDKGLKQFNKGNFILADSLFRLSIKIEPTEMAYFYKTKSNRNPKVNCDECCKYKTALDKGNMTVLEKYCAECFSSDSISYKESSTDDIISYCKVWILLCDDITIEYSFFQKELKTQVVKSFSTINDSTKSPVKLPINHFPKRSNLNQDSILIINPGIQPTFPGGDQARLNFIQQNLHYPEDAKANGIQGIVRVSFIVDEKGNISDPKIFSGIGKSCDDECIRIVKLMPKWNPGIENGKYAKATYNLPFRFTLQ